MATLNPPPPPPKISTDPAQGLAAVVEYLWQFYNNIMAQFAYTKEVTGYDPNSFNPSALPDPASTTLGQAQKTANDAYGIASGAKADAEAAKTQAQSATDRIKYWFHGQVTVSGTNNTQEYVFPPEAVQPDANYNIVFSSDSYTGTPGFDATQVIKCVRASDKFTVTVNSAPGSGNSVTLHWQIRR